MLCRMIVGLFTLRFFFYGSINSTMRSLNALPTNAYCNILFSTDKLCKVDYKFTNSRPISTKQYDKTDQMFWHAVSERLRHMTPFSSQQQPRMSLMFFFISRPNWTDLLGNNSTIISPLVGCHGNHKPSLTSVVHVPILKRVIMSDLPAAVLICTPIQSFGCIDTKKDCTVHIKKIVCN